MTRGLSSANETASKDEVVRIINLIQFYFDSGTTHYCTGDMSVNWNGFTYIAVGNIGSITPVQETVNLQASSVIFRVSGLPVSGWINTFLNEQVQGRIVKMYTGYFDRTWKLIDTPVLIFQGTMDTVDLDIGDTATVSISAQNKLTDWDRADNTNFSQNDQKARYPNDNFFNFVEKMVDQAIHWGSDGTSQDTARK